MACGGAEVDGDVDGEPLVPGARVGGLEQPPDVSAGHGDDGVVLVGGLQLGPDEDPVAVARVGLVRAAGRCGWRAGSRGRRCSCSAGRRRRDSRRRRTGAGTGWTGGGGGRLSRSRCIWARGAGRCGRRGRGSRAWSSAMPRWSRGCRAPPSTGRRGSPSCRDCARCGGCLRADPSAHVSGGPNVSRSGAWFTGRNSWSAQGGHCVATSGGSSSSRLRQ